MGTSVQLGMGETVILPLQDLMAATRQLLGPLLSGEPGEAMATAFLTAMLEGYFVDAEHRALNDWMARYDLPAEAIGRQARALEYLFSKQLYHLFGGLVPSYRYRYVIQVGGANEGIHITATLPTQEDSLAQLRLASNPEEGYSPARYRR